MEDREGKEKGGSEAGRPSDRKTRRPEGPSAQSLRDLTLVLLVFARDVSQESVPVEQAAAALADNLDLFYERLHGRG